MNDTLNPMVMLALAWMAGAMLGGFFFGGLWWTVRHVIDSTRSALWLSASLLLRMGVTLTGFYVVSDGQWQPLLACLFGFIMARGVVTWLTRSTLAPPPPAATHHAS
ncbi:MAG: F1F0 ATPase subunit 2 [Candidatus Paceibacteria bacterium]|jgi:F1F0 ATPase subunit 2